MISVDLLKENIPAPNCQFSLLCCENFNAENGVFKQRESMCVLKCTTVAN